MAGLTRNLKLRLSNELTSDARYNLERIDQLGTVFPFTASLTGSFQHSWATTDVQVEVYDSVTGETCYAYVTRASNSVTITFNQTPTNPLRVLLREMDGSQTTITVS